jgi:hypothetical protein
VWRIAAEYRDDFVLRDGDVVSVSEHVIPCVDQSVLMEVLQRYVVEKQRSGSAPEDWAEFVERAHGACSRRLAT